MTLVLLSCPPYPCDISLTPFTASSQVLSHHLRLGSPLPHRDAACLAHFMSASFYPSTLELHESILAAIADLYIHGAALPPVMTEGAGADLPPVSAGNDGPIPDQPMVPSGPCKAAAIWRRVWEVHGALTLDRVPATLERVRCVETLGTVSTGNMLASLRQCSSLQPVSDSILTIK